MDDEGLRKVSRLLARPDIVSMTLAEMMVTLVFLVLIIGVASGAFVTGKAATRAELEVENRRLAAVEGALVKGVEKLAAVDGSLVTGLGKIDVVPTDVDELFSRLVDIARLKQDLVRLRSEQEVDRAALRELESSVSAEAKDWFAKYTASRKAAAEVQRALDTAREALAAARERAKADERRVAELTEALADVRQRSQVAQSRLASLEKKVDSRGVDAPACWRQGDDPDGPLEYALNITLFDDVLEVTAAWPAARADQALLLSLPRTGLKAVMTPDAFMRMARPLYDDSIKRGCRYFVQVDDTNVQEVEALRRQRSLVERYFYVKWGRHG